MFDGIQFATETILQIIVLLQGSPGIHQDTSLFLPGVCLTIFALYLHIWQAEAGKMVLTASQFARCTAVNKTPDVAYENVP